MSSRAAGRLPAIVLIAAIATLVLLPVAALIGAALESGPSAALAATFGAAPAIIATLVTAVAATVLALAGGTLLAVATERAAIPGRRALRLALLLGLVAPGYVAAIGWQRVYGEAIEGPMGISLVLGVEALPLVYLIVAAALGGAREIDIERAARAAGAGPLTTLRTITLPLLAPTLAGAGAIAFVFSATAFGAPAVLGIPAGFTTMTTRIYRDLAFSADPDAFARAIGLAIVLAGLTTLALAAAARWLDPISVRSGGTTAQLWVAGDRQAAWRRAASRSQPWPGSSSASRCCCPSAACC